MIDTDPERIAGAEIFQKVVDVHLMAAIVGFLVMRRPFNSGPEPVPPILTPVKYKLSATEVQPILI